MDTAQVRFVTQKDNIFDEMSPDEEPGGQGPSNGGSNGHGPASDTGPTGPFTALSSSELAAVTIEDDEDLEDLSGEVEPSEDSVRAKMPVGPGASAALTMAPTAVPSLDQAAADLDWGVEEAATRAATGAERIEPPPQTLTSLGMAAPPLADAFTVQPGAPAPATADAYDRDLAFAPTMGIPTAPPALPPVVSPFRLVADVEAAPPPPPPAPPAFAAFSTPLPPQPVQPWGTPVAGSSGSVAPFHAPAPLPVIPDVEDPLPSTRAMPELAPAFAPAFAPTVSPVEDDFPLPAPRKSSAGTVIGILVGVVIAAVIAAGVWWFQLREQTGTLVLRAPQDASVSVDGAPANGVSGLFIVRDLGVGPHTVVMTRPGAAPWANAVQITAGDSLQIETPGARGGDTGSTNTVATSPMLPGPIPPLTPPVPGVAPGAPLQTPTVTTTTTLPPGASTTTPAPSPLPRQPATPRTTPGTTPATTPRTPANEPTARGGSGFLSVNTIPWAAVEVDGRSVGNTPVLRHELRAGDHRVTLIVQAWNIRQTRRVVIRPGETATVTVRFQEPGTQAAPQGPGPGGPGPMGPRPMGPGAGPMGPRPMGPGPGPMGPRPMGPGPMGPPPRN